MYPKRCRFRGRPGTRNPHPVPAQIISITQPQYQELIELSAPLELAATLWPLAHGTGDPTIRFAADGVWRAMRLAQGVATLNLRQLGPATLRARAWGPGGAAAISMVGELV